MNEIEKKFNEIDKWISKNKELVNRIINDRQTYDFERKKAIFWHEDVSKNKDLMFGVKKITLEELSNHMTNIVKPIKNPKNTGHPLYDEDGHCSDYNWNNIHNFWKALRKEDIPYILSGELDEDLELSGGRSYLLSGDIVIMLFNYIYYTLKWNKEQVDKCICNSNDLSDSIMNLYPPKFKVPSIEQSKKELHEKQEKEKMSYANFLVKYDKEQKHPNLEFVGNSKIDNKPIYKVKIPYGCEVILSVDEQLK